MAEEKPVGTLNCQDATKWGSNQWVNEGKAIVEPIGFSHTQGLSAQPSETVWPTLPSEGGGQAVAFNAFDTGDTRTATAIVQPTPIQGSMIGRADHAGPGGRGYGEEGGPMFTLNTTDRHAIAAVPIQDGREIEKRQNGLGVGSEGDPAYTLDQTGAQSVAIVDFTHDSEVRVYDSVAPSLTASNDPSRSPQSAEITQQVTAVHEATMTVRRLTPVECERLMGWPDGWTDGQADSHRYKQCGNGVASPVARWIAGHLSRVLNETAVGGLDPQGE